MTVAMIVVIIRMLSPPLMLIEVDDNTFTILHYLFSKISMKT